jgi:hypothetical protein
LPQDVRLRAHGPSQLSRRYSKSLFKSLWSIVHWYQQNVIKQYYENAGKIKPWDRQYHGRLRLDQSACLRLKEDAGSRSPQPTKQRQLLWTSERTWRAQGSVAGSMPPFQTCQLTLEPGHCNEGTTITYVVYCNCRFRILSFRCCLERSNS